MRKQIKKQDEYTSPYDNWRFGLITGILAVSLMLAVYFALK